MSIEKMTPNGGLGGTSTEKDGRKKNRKKYQTG
jgi:hypothetical protein